VTRAHVRKTGGRAARVCWFGGVKKQKFKNTKNEKRLPVNPDTKKKKKQQQKSNRIPNERKNRIAPRDDE